MACCEEAIRRENEALDRYEHTVALNEEKIFQKINTRMGVEQSIRNGGGASSHIHSEDCSHILAQANENGAESTGDDILAQIRAKRLAELKVQSLNKQAKQKEGFGSYTRLTEEEMWTQTRTQEEVIFIVHFYQDDDELNIYVDEHLQNIAGNFINFKFIQIEQLTRQTTSLVCFKESSNLAQWSIHFDEQEPEEIWEQINKWLEKIVERLDNVDVEDIINKYCGRHNCDSNFPHEHIEWGKTNSMAKSTDDEQHDNKPSGVTGFQRTRQGNNYSNFRDDLVDEEDDSLDLDL